MANAIKIESYQQVELDVPQLSEIASSFQSVLSSNFKQVEVKVVECPDLREEPWLLKSKGIGGNTVLADVGGVDNLHYPENNRVAFTLQDVRNVVGIADGFVMGPGAGNPNQIGVNSELIVNEVPQGEGVNIKDSCGTKVVIVEKDQSYRQFDSETGDFGVLANLFVSEGKSGEVVYVKAKTRTGENNFVSLLRKSLVDSFPNKHFAFGGVFRITHSKVKAHVMPDFTKSDMLSNEVVNEWLKFYEMKGPLNCTSIFFNGDVNNLGFRQEHTHFWSKHGDGGHYHKDITPEEVEYEGYFMYCHKAFRIQPPNISSQRTSLFGKP
eukprot:TRINITY_DN5582_c0_g1_i4.p1 TRINITY_DN5582_c0_g1~~TRINITY_DN5582_c0_g1_i4.p1  ORF type:complete len:324 (-),score=111.65 TRINITY_DN5582_c0_g1_i4:38-1009(-)